MTKTTTPSQQIFSIYSLIVIAAGGAALASWPTIPWREWPLMTLLIALGLVARRLEFNLGKLAGIGFDTSVHLVAATLLGPGGAALVASLAAMLGLWLHPKTRAYPWRLRLLTVGRNGGMFVLMQLGSGAVFVAAGGAKEYSLSAWQAWLLPLLWLLVYHLINALVGYTPYLLTRRITWRAVLASDPSVFVAELATVPGGILLISLYRAEGIIGLAALGSGLIAISTLVRRLANASQRLETQLKASTTLTQVGHALSASLDRDTVLELIQQHALQVMGARTLSIALYDPAEQTIHYPLIIEEGQRYPPCAARFDASEGLTSHIIAARQGLYLNTPEDMQSYRARQLVTGTGVRMQSYLGAPMIARGNVIGVLSVQSPLRNAFTQDDLNTLTTLAQQAAISIDNTRLVHELAARERMKQELEIARRTQLSLMPASAPSLPGLDIAGVSLPAVEVGGDFYSYHPLPQHLGLAIGDVSGKGMPAALLMALAAGILEAEAPRTVSPAEMLANVDRALHPHAVRSRLNVACSYVILERSASRLLVANAGMPSPLIRRNDGQIEWIETCGLPLGVPGVQAQYLEAAHSLLAGDALILASDGILEAKNSRGEMFSFERFEQAVAAAPVEQGAQAALDFLLAQMRAFIDPASPHDDVTLVVVKRVGPGKKI